VAQVKLARAAYTKMDALSIKEAHTILELAEVMLKQLQDDGEVIHDSLVSEMYRIRGRCEKEFGDIREAVASYSTALKHAHLEDDVHDILHDRALAYMTESNVAAAQQDMDSILRENPRRMATWGIQGLMYQNMGRCVEAIQSFEKMVELEGPTKRESAPHLLSASCFRIMGKYGHAAESLRLLRLLGTKPTAILREEVLAYDYLSQDWPLNSYNLDASMSVELKLCLVYSVDQEQVNIAGVLAKQNESLHERVRLLESRGLGMYAPTHGYMLDTYTKKVKAEGGYKVSPEKEVEMAALAARMAPVLKEIATLSSVQQLLSPGFLTNVLQHRQSSLAAVQMASSLLAHMRALREGPGLRVPNAVLSSVLSSGFRRSDDQPTMHYFHWRDFFDIAVRFRHVSAPLDNVFWADSLLVNDVTDLGFIGMTTHITSGHDKVVRYYDQHDKAMALVKRLVLTQGFYTPDKELVSVPANSFHAAAIERASTLEELYMATHGGNFYVVTDLQSERDGEKKLPGTLFSIIRQEYGYAFSICLPTSPTRFADFEMEMDHAFKRVVEALQAHDRQQRDTENAILNQGSLKNSKRVGESERAVRRAALGMFYYWANFGPLTRGSSSAGYTALVAVLLTVGVEVDSQLPKGIQLDWEAFYAPNVRDFISNVEALLPLRRSAVRLDGAAIKDLVAALSTTRRVKTLLFA
jgi:tetratricopeptide (TPR) repeat protein